MSKRVKIPSAVTLGSHRFTIHRASHEALQRIAGCPAYGVFLPESQSIYVIEQGSRRQGPSASLCLQTYYHELAHAMLWVMGHKDYTHEKVIDQLGHLLKQAQETAE